MTQPAKKAPAARKAPQDHQPKKQSPVEGTRTITLGGREYTVEMERLDDLRVLEAYEEEKWVVVLKLILGPEQWARFYLDHGDVNGRITGRKFGELIEDLNGTDLMGNL